MTNRELAEDALVFLELAAESVVHALDSLREIKAPELADVRGLAGQAGALRTLLDQVSEGELQRLHGERLELEASRGGRGIAAMIAEEHPVALQGRSQGETLVWACQRPQRR